MDPLAKQMKAMIERCESDCDLATDAQLETWAKTDTILGMFAQREMVWRDRDRVLDVALAMVQS